MKIMSYIKKLPDNSGLLVSSGSNRPVNLFSRSYGFQALTLQEVTKPVAAITALLNGLLPASTPCDSWPAQNADPHEKKIYLISAGRFDTFRITDRLYTGTGCGPDIIGLSDLFTDIPGRHTIEVDEDATVHCLPVSQAKRLIERHDLWKSASLVLTHALMHMVYRDESVIAKSAYSIVRTRLREYMQSRERYIRQKISIGAFIQQTTPLSRKLIYKILAELADHGHIVISRGRLEKIVRLPEHY